MQARKPIVDQAALGSEKKKLEKYWKLSPKAFRQRKKSQSPTSRPRRFFQIRSEELQQKDIRKQVELLTIENL